MESEIQPDSQRQNGSEQTRISKVWNQYYATFTVSLGSFATGALGGWVSPMIQILESDDSPVGKMTIMEISPLETLPNVASIIGIVLFAYIITRFGRKVTGYISFMLCVIGVLLLLFATTKIELYIGSFISGFSMVGFGIVGPVYLSEVAHSSIRGALMTWTQFAIYSGSLASYLLGTVCSYKLFTCLGLIAPTLFLILFVKLPESPLYLIMKSKTSEAHKAMLWYRADSKEVDEELLALSRVTPKKIEYRAVLQSKVNRKILAITMFLYTFNAMSGGTVIMGYASKIFEEGHSPIKPNTSAAVLAFIRFVSALSSVFVVDRCGRRILVILSFLFMGISLIVTTVYFFLLQTGSTVNDMGWIPIASLSTFIAVNTMGVSTVGEVIGTEMLTPEVKGIALGIMGVATTSSILLSLQLYAIFVEYVGMYFNFLFEAVFAIASVIISWLVVPETKGKSIAEIIDVLDGKFAKQKTESKDIITEEMNAETASVEGHNPGI